jgi:uncharacterized protein (DUF58 family)
MSATSLVVPLGRQGPGRLSADAVARLELALRRRAGGVLPGDHRTAGLGDATELAQLRPYEPGDDVRRLDPAASARTAVPHVRLHVPERTVTTWLVLDVSASMAFGTGDRLKSDVAEGVAEVVTRLAVRRGGRIAVTTAGPERPRQMRPLSGRGALATVRSLVREGVTPDGAGASEPTGLADALTRVSRLARAPGVVVVVSDFRDEGWRAPLRRAAARHTVIAVEVADAREGELVDAGTLFLVDPETGEEVEVDTTSPRVRDAFAAAEAGRRAAVATELRRAPAQHVVLGTDRDWVRDLGRALR